MTVYENGVEVPYRKAPAQTWFAEIELDHQAPTQVLAEFDYGASSDVKSVVWKEFNLLTENLGTDPMKIRLGSTMNLTAVPQEVLVPEAQYMTITVTDPDGALTPIPLSSGLLAEVLFDREGIYTIHGTYDDGTLLEAGFEVDVIGGGLKGNPVVGQGKTYSWDNPDLPEGMTLGVEQGLTLTDRGPLANGGTRFDLLSTNVNVSYIAARLGERMPILDSAEITTLILKSNVYTSVDNLVTYPDGSRLVGTPVILNDVPEDLSIEVEIFVSGVTFEDGTTRKTFTASDFDAYDRIYLKFLKAPDVSTAHCHRIHVRVGDNYIDTF